MNYFNWFISKGFKKYLLPFLLGGFITSAFYIHREEAILAPKIILYLAWFSIASFDIGIAYHSILTYKIDNKK